MYEQFITHNREKQLASLIASNSTQNVHTTIDRLTLVFDLKWPERNLEKLSEHTDFIEYLPPRNRKLGYQYTIATASGLHIELAPLKHPALQNVRMEFNPNKFNPVDTLYHPLMLHAKWIRITRIDYAIDFPHDLSLYHWQTEKARTQVKFLSATDQLETLYLGKKDSADFYRIYDKAKEQGESETRWRVEHVFKLDKKTSYPDLAPFGNLYGWKPDTFTGDFYDDTILAELYKHPQSFTRLSRRKQEHFRRLMKNNSRTVHPQITPADIYRATCQPLNNFLWHLVNQEPLV